MGNERDVENGGRGRTRVDGDKNGLRMGMFVLISSLSLYTILIIVLFYIYHLQCHSILPHELDLDLDHIHLPIPNPTLHAISSLISTMVSPSLLHALNALGSTESSLPNLPNLSPPQTLLDMIRNHPHLSHSTPYSPLNPPYRPLDPPMLFEPSLYPLPPLPSPTRHSPRSLRLKQTH